MDMKQKSLKALAICIGVVLMVLLLLSCSSDIDITPQVQTEDKNIQELVSLTFDKEKVYLSSEEIRSETFCEKDYKLFENGDYSFTYIWPFQTANVFVHNTEDCQFGDPGEPVLKFTYRQDNIYEGKLQLELCYVTDGKIKSTLLTGNFTVVID